LLWGELKTRGPLTEESFGRALVVANDFIRFAQEARGDVEVGGFATEFLGVFGFVLCFVSGLGGAAMEKPVMRFVSGTCGVGALAGTASFAGGI
jgi:hypothetical protein